MLRLATHRNNSCHYSRKVQFFVLFDDWFKPLSLLGYKEKLHMVHALSEM